MPYLKGFIDIYKFYRVLLLENKKWILFILQWALFWLKQNLQLVPLLLFLLLIAALIEVYVSQWLTMWATSMVTSFPQTSSL